MIGRDPDAGRVCGQARSVPVHRVDAVRPASRARRKSALCRRSVRPQHQPRAEMELRRGNHGGSRDRASRGAAGAGAVDHPVRLRAAQSARPDAGAVRQAHDLRVARDAAQSGHGRGSLRRLEARVLGEDHRDVRALLPEHDAQEHSRPICLHGGRVHPGARQHARRRHFHGRVQRRAGDVQPLRLSHADPEFVLRRLRRASGRRDLGWCELHHRRASSRATSGSSRGGSPGTRAPRWRRW